jgi:hypothetical protein
MLLKRGGLWVLTDVFRHLSHPGTDGFGLCAGIWFKLSLGKDVATVENSKSESERFYWGSLKNSRTNQDKEDSGAHMLIFKIHSSVCVVARIC